ncbi:MAG: GNAT family N-acetyltransferase [Pseudomonadota bacterium]
MTAADGAIPPGFTLVDLFETDIDRIQALHEAAMGAVPDPSAVRTDEPSFFAGIFHYGGEIVGLERDGELVAYGVLRPELESELDRVGLDGLVPARERLWVLDGSAARPDLWRGGLQRTLISLRLARLRQTAIDHAIAKASPRNIPSMRNLLKRGFATVGMVKKSYGWRYVQYRRVATAVSVPETGEWIEAADVVEVARHLDDGEFATTCRVGGDGIARLQFAILPDLKRA